MNADTARGVLLGVACGDALGRPVEGWPADRIQRRYGTLEEMVGQGAHGLPPGSITDDTEMTRCLARSLADAGEWDPDDAADRFVQWFRGDPTGIGGMTFRVLSRVADGTPWDAAAREVWEESPEGRNAGNGSLMRCSPVAVAFTGDREQIVAVSRESSKLTHWDPRCQDSCAALNLAIAAATRDRDPVAAALGSLGERANETVVAALERARDRASAGETDTLPGTGYVIDTLEAGVGHVLATDSAEKAIVSAVNNGGDSDTVGAVAGALAGATYGESGLPDPWLDALDCREELTDLAETLCEP